MSWNFFGKEKSVFKKFKMSRIEPFHGNYEFLAVSPLMYSSLFYETEAYISKGE